MVFETSAAYANPSERMRINSDGNVGIGTDSPDAKLDVNGDAIFAGNVTLNEDLNFSTNGFADISNTGTGAMRFKPSSQTLALTLTGANATFAGDVTANSFIKDGGASSEYLMADGSVSTGSASVGWTELTGNQEDINLSDFNDDLGYGTGSVRGSGTDNTIAMFDGTGDIQDSVIIQKSNNYIGIQKSLPGAPLHIYNNEDGKSTNLILENGDTALTTGQAVGAVVFRSNDASTDAAGNSGSITSIAENPTGKYGMSFKTKNLASINEGLYIDPDGKIGLGTDDPIGVLDIEGMTTTTPAIKVNAGAGDNLIMDIYNSSDVKRMGMEYDNSNINFNITDRDTNKLFTVRETGNVGIGDDTPTYKLDVSGSIRATGDVTATSDVRTKENIKTIENASLKVSKLRGVEFNKIGEDNKSIGVIAQEVESVIPEVVKTDNEGMKSVAYGNLVGLLIESNKELIESNKELLKRIEILESK